MILRVANLGSLVADDLQKDQKKVSMRYLSKEIVSIL
jgi:hypothetical protein